MRKSLVTALVLRSFVALGPLSGCGATEHAPLAPKAVMPVAAGKGSQASVTDPPALVTDAASPSKSARPPEHWFFEWLSEDGNRALLRRLDGEARSTLQTRVVDVQTGATLAEATFPELGKIPSSTIGRRPNEVSELFGMLTSPAFGDELVRGARIAEEFPFGTCGRFTTAVQGGPIAFNAGDWLYLADDAGRVQRRLTVEAAYDPRFTPDGTNLIFRRANGTVDKVRAKYELFVMPADLSSPPRVLPGTAGSRDQFSVDLEGRAAVTIASQEPQIKTCALSIGLRAPFAVKRLACLDGAEPLVESVLSIHGRFAALTTQTSGKSATDGTPTLAWRLRVLSLDTGKIELDEPEEAGMMVRAISDTGLLVKSGPRGVELTDVSAHRRRVLAHPVELGHRGFFRNASELVVVRGGAVGVVDLAAD